MAHSGRASLLPRCCSYACATWSCTTQLWITPTNRADAVRSFQVLCPLILFGFQLVSAASITLWYYNPMLSHRSFNRQPPLSPDTLATLKDRECQSNKQWYTKPDAETSLQRSAVGRYRRRCRRTAASYGGRGCGRRGSGCRAGRHTGSNHLGSAFAPKSLADVAR